MRIHRGKRMVACVSEQLGPYDTPNSPVKFGSPKNPRRRQRLSQDRDPNDETAKMKKIRFDFHADEKDDEEMHLTDSTSLAQPEGGTHDLSSSKSISLSSTLNHASTVEVTDNLDGFISPSAISPPASRTSSKDLLTTPRSILRSVQSPSPLKSVRFAAGERLCQTKTFDIERKTPPRPLPLRKGKGKRRKNHGSSSPMTNVLSANVASTSNAPGTPLFARDITGHSSGIAMSNAQKRRTPDSSPQTASESRWQRQQAFLSSISSSPPPSEYSTYNDAETRNRLRDQDVSQSLQHSLDLRMSGQYFSPLTTQIPSPFFASPLPMDTDEKDAYGLLCDTGHTVDVALKVQQGKEIQETWLPRLHTVSTALTKAAKGLQAVPQDASGMNVDDPYGSSPSTSLDDRQAPDSDTVANPASMLPPTEQLRVLVDIFQNALEVVEAHARPVMADNESQTLSTSTLDFAAQTESPATQTTGIQTTPPATSSCGFQTTPPPSLSLSSHEFSKVLSPPPALAVHTQEFALTSSSTSTSSHTPSHSTPENSTQNDLQQQLEDALSRVQSLERSEASRQSLLLAVVIRNARLAQQLALSAIRNRGARMQSPQTAHPWTSPVGNVTDSAHSISGTGNTSHPAPRKVTNEKRECVVTLSSAPPSTPAKGSELVTIVQVTDTQSDERLTFSLSTPSPRRTSLRAVTNASRKLAEEHEVKNKNGSSKNSTSKTGGKAAKGKPVGNVADLEEFLRACGTVIKPRGYGPHLTSCTACQQADV